MTDARSAGADPGAHGDGVPPASYQAAAPQRSGHRPTRHPVAAFFRANPQVLALLVVCIVLGVGTFLAVLFGLVTAGSDQTTGEPSGSLLGAHVALTALRSALP